MQVVAENRDYWISEIEKEIRKIATDRCFDDLIASRPLLQKARERFGTPKMPVVSDHMVSEPEFYKSKHRKQDLAELRVLEKVFKLHMGGEDIILDQSDLCLFSWFQSATDLH